MSWRRPFTPCFPKWPISSVNQTQTRYVRIKHGLNPYDTSLKRDERLLKRLEAQLVDVQARMKREEQEAESLLKRDKTRNDPQNSSPSEGLPNHNVIFWKKVLSKDDRRMLASHGISSLEDLASAYDAVELKLSQPPHPKIETLDAKSQYVYDIYQSIPFKLQEAGRRKAASWFGTWF